MTSKIYFIQVQPGGPIKIGITDGDPSYRMSDLQTGCPWPLDLIGAITGSFGHELALHRRFSTIRMQGEWFQPTSELVATIQEMLAPGFSFPVITEVQSASQEAFARIIDLFGRPEDFANAIGIPKSHARIMRGRCSIPLRYWRRAIDAAKERNIDGVTMDVMAEIADTRLREATTRSKAETTQ
jgi:hypothetical protein